MAAITLKDIVKKYGDGYPAVNGVSLDIADGEFVILVGPSGCGKSTLLRMIVGLEDITDGDLEIGGKRVNEKAPKDRNLAMVFQNYALYPHLTVAENIAFPLRLRKGVFTEDEIQKKVAHAAETLELTDHLDRKPANLSGGQRQRVAMGRAIVREADAFLFDEPLSNLDAKLRGQMRTEIARMQRRLGTTTVYVTHDQTEAMTLGDRVAVLRKGELQQVASPRALYEQPVNLFVAGFIGSPPMNFMPGEIADGQITLPFGTFTMPERIATAVGDRSLVIVGLRPEHFEDAALVEESKKHTGETFDVAVDVTEWMGSDLFAYVPFETHPDVSAKLEELDRDLDGEGMRTQFIVGLDSASRVRDGDTTTLWFNPEKMLIFDPEGGENLTRDTDEVERLDRENEEDRKASLDRARRKADSEAGGAEGGAAGGDQGRQSGDGNLKTAS